MNAQRRRKINRFLAELEEMREYFESLVSEEQDSFNNIPEAFEGTERYEKAEEVLDYLNEALDGFEEIRENIENAIE